eukprot:2762512-Prymnesium_polylepis.2
MVQLGLSSTERHTNATLNDGTVELQSSVYGVGDVLTSPLFYGSLTLIIITAVRARRAEICLECRQPRAAQTAAGPRPTPTHRLSRPHHLAHTTSLGRRLASPSLSVCADAAR